jgi:sugar/nucleoside kinase (ribokinase family)
VKHVVVGHTAIDRIITDEGESYRLGGPPSYSCAISSVLDNGLDLITRIGPDFPEEYVERFSSWGVDLERWRCETPTTVFVLDYTKEPRGLGVDTMCDLITLEENSDSILLSPITNELTGEQVKNIDAGFVSLDPQGLIRDCNPPSIRLTTWTPEDLSNIHLLKTSIYEHMYLTGETNPLRSLKVFSNMGVKTSIITMGGDGSVAHHDGVYYTVPIYPTNSIDTTGAGDCFLAIVHDSLASGEPVEWALAVASAVASGMIETLGPDFVLSKKDVTRRAESVIEGIQKRT